MNNYFNQNSSNEVYFAADEGKKTAAVLLAKSQSFYNVLRSNSYMSKLNKMWRAYHGHYTEDQQFGHEVAFTGEQGELVQIPVNHFRNIALHILNMITTNRPTLEARAINSDYRSLAQTYVANDILEYYMRDRRLESRIKTATEMAIVLGTGFIRAEWNTSAGEAYDADPETGDMIYEGDVEFTNLSPLDVVFDGTKDTWDMDWCLVRTSKNRFDLAAKWPEYREQILATQSKINTNNYRLSIWSNDSTDDVYVYEFYHKKTDAMPEGRHLMFVDADTILFDGPLVYRQIPIFRISGGDYMGTAYGYSPMFDVFPLQEAINSTYSTILTNQNAFGVQNVFVPRGADIDMSSISGGLNIIEGNAKPESINLTQTPAEVFKFLDKLIADAETISGVNAVARGNPPPSLESGTALALIQSMSLQFISGLQQSYVHLLEDTGSSLISMLKDFAKTPKTISVVGKAKGPLLREFTGDSISAINRVIVDVGNPLSRTIAGRVEMATQMLQQNLIKNNQQYLQVINTGRLDVMFEGETSGLLLIKSENEAFLNGENPIVSFLDQHAQHILEHQSVLNNPDMRKDPHLVQNVNDHMQQHINFLRTTSPDLLMLTGQQPLQPIGAPQGAPQMNGPMDTQGGVPQPGPSGNTQTDPSQQPQQMAQPGEQGPMGSNGPQEGMPNIPKVDSNLLSNPDIQQQAMGNVK